MSREHTHATEALIIISQTFFLVFLFLFLKKTLVDNRKMMANRRLMQKNSLQLVSIFFSILVLLFLITIPLWNYKYSEIVAVFVLAIIAAILGHDIKRILEGQGVSDPPFRENDDIVSVDIERPDVKKEEKGPPVRPVLPKRIQQNEKKLEKSKSLFDLKDTIKSAFGPSKPLVQKQVSGTSHGFNF